VPTVLTVRARERVPVRYQSPAGHCYGDRGPKRKVVSVSALATGLRARAAGEPYAEESAITAYRVFTIPKMPVCLTDTVDGMLLFAG